MGYWEQIGVENKRRSSSPHRRRLDDLGVLLLLLALPTLLFVVGWLASP